MIDTNDICRVDHVKKFQISNDLIHSGLKKIVLDSDVILSDNESYNRPYY